MVCDAKREKPDLQSVRTSASARGRTSFIAWERDEAGYDLKGLLARLFKQQQQKLVTLKHIRKLNIHTQSVLWLTDALSTFKGLASPHENQIFSTSCCNFLPQRETVASRGFTPGSHPTCMEVLEEIHSSVFSRVRSDH